jgi:predicted nucleic acid-binding Zn ribbon protein
MTDIVVNHAHCWICGKATAHSGEKGPQVCSDACRAQMNEQNKKRKTFMYLLYAAMAFMVLVLVFQVRG